MSIGHVRAAGAERAFVNLVEIDLPRKIARKLPRVGKKTPGFEIFPGQFGQVKVQRQVGRQVDHLDFEAQAGGGRAHAEYLSGATGQVHAV